MGWVSNIAIVFRERAVHVFISSLSSSEAAAAGASRRTAEGDEGLCVCPKCWQPLLPRWKKHHHSLNLLHFVWCRLRGQLIDVLLYDSLKVAGWVRKVTVEVWRGRHLGSSSSSGSRARPRRRFHTHTARHSHQPKKVKSACLLLLSF